MDIRSFYTLVDLNAAPLGADLLASLVVQPETARCSLVSRHKEALPRACSRRGDELAGERLTHLLSLLYFLQVRGESRGQKVTSMQYTKLTH